MVDPLLHTTLHLHLLHPVDIVGSGLVVRRTGHKCVKLLLSIGVLSLDVVDLHPLKEFGMVNDVLLKCVARFVDIIDVHFGVIGIHLATTLVDGQEHRLNTRCGLRHQARGSGGCDGKTGDIASSVGHHFVI